MRTSILLFLFLCALLNLKGQDYCAPQTPLALTANKIKPENIESLLATHQDRSLFDESTVLSTMKQIDQCNQSMGGRLLNIETISGGLAQRLQQVLAVRDVEGTQKQINDLEKSLEEAISSLKERMQTTQRKGLYIVMLPNINPLTNVTEFQKQSLDALTMNAIEEINGTAITRLTTVINQSQVKDAIKALSQGEVKQDRSLFDQPNYEQRYFLYFGLINVTPLDQSRFSGRPYNPANQNAVVINPLLETNFASKLRSLGVTAEHVNRIEGLMQSYVGTIKNANENTAFQREQMVNDSEQQIKDLENQIKALKEQISSRSDKIRQHCQDLNVPFKPNDINASAQDVLDEIRTKLEVNKTTWRIEKGKEILHRSSVITISGKPIEIIAAETMKLVNRLITDYSTVAKNEEVVGIENNEVTDYNNTRQIELYRNIDKIWVMPVGQSDGSFKVYVFATFEISDQIVPHDKDPIPVKEEEDNTTLDPKNTQQVGNTSQFEIKGSPYPPSSSNKTLEELPAEETMLIPNLVWVSGGAFSMGDADEKGDRDAQPAHEVVLKGFYLAKNEVTFTEYDAFCEATRRNKPDDEDWGRGNRPVINVSWYDAIDFCNWLSQEHGLDKVYRKSGNDVSANWDANGYRLPTEAEWEYAAREAGKRVRFGNGQDIADPSDINFNGGSLITKIYSETTRHRGKTIPVGSINSANSLNLYDMSGNISEWCWDWYKRKYYEESETEQPYGPESGLMKVHRGGSWFNQENFCQTTSRGSGFPNFFNNGIGFRIAKSY